MSARNSPKAAQPAPYVTIYESELQVIAGEAALKQRLETGGDLYGAQTRAGRPVIFLATGPGPQAVHAETKFTQDFEFCQATGQVLEDNCGLQWQGTWHSHHELGLPRPSGGDAQKVKTLTRRNALSQWLEIIATHERATPKSFSLFSPSRKRLSESSDALRVRTGAFVYTDPQNGEHVASALRILPGLSPVRLMLLARGRFDRRSLGEHAVGFPLARVEFEAWKSKAAAEDEPAKVPPGIVAQLEQLPEAVQHTVELAFTETLVVVTFKLPDGRLADVGLNRSAPHALKALRVREPATGHKSLLTQEFVDAKHERLSEIHQALVERDARGIASAGAAIHVPRVDVAASIAAIGGAALGARVDVTD
jgi:hypothetical protein